MRSFLYLLSIALVLGWIVGVMGFKMGGWFHLLLLSGIIALLMGLARRSATE